MGYFPNGTSGMLYQEEWCVRCVHDVNEDCPVWAAHLMYSSRDCNDPASILHMLIPIAEDGLSNERCLMFAEDRDPERSRGRRADEQYMLWRETAQKPA